MMDEWYEAVDGAAEELAMAQEVSCPDFAIITSVDFHHASNRPVSVPKCFVLNEDDIIFPDIVKSGCPFAAAMQ